MVNRVITIGRQAGSGGREIGQKIAEDLGIRCYDKELLDRAAKESGLCKEIFENHDERHNRSFLYSLVMDTYSMGYASSVFGDMPINQKVFLAQFESIKKLASEESCVIVGRCADYALADHPGLFSIFVHGNMDDRVARIMRVRDLDGKKAKDLIVKTDKERSSYYNYYTSKEWGASGSYHMCIDSGRFGIDGSVKLIETALELL